MARKARNQHISEVLESCGHLKSLVNATRQQEALLHLVKSRLPDPLCDHCLGAQLEDNSLTLLTDSPAWRNRLHFLQGQLRQTLGAVGTPFQRLQVKVVAMERQQPEKHREKPNAIPDQAARAIRHAAESSQNPQLREALMRLSRRC
jgi:hypothetical protein